MLKKSGTGYFVGNKVTSRGWERDERRKGKRRQRGEGERDKERE